jgi:hypothetical protein
MSVEVGKTAVSSEVLLGLGVHDGLTIGALRGGEGGRRAAVEGRHGETVGSLHARGGGWAESGMRTGSRGCWSAGSIGAGHV